MTICKNVKCRKCDFYTDGECALIDGVELAIDCGYELPEEHLKRYHYLIDQRRRSLSAKLE